MDNKNPEISVLLPIYNTKTEHLNACIQSLLNQTFIDFELIILDDASNIDFKEVIDKFNDKRIKYFKNDTNLGITKTRNKLLDLAHGKYIAIADHDDISKPYRLEKEYKFLENNKDFSIVSGWLEVFRENSKKKKIWKRKKYPKLLDFLEQCELLHPACMWRKEDFEKYNLKYEDGYFGVQDYALFSKAVKHLKFANLQEVLLEYRKHENNASNNKNKMCLEAEKVKSEILDFLTDDKKAQEYLYEKFAIPKVSFIKNIFSIINIANLKIIRILGIKIKLKRF